MKELYELKEKLCNELKNYGRKEMSSVSLEVIDKLAHTIKNLDKIIYNFDTEGYSGDYMSDVGYRNGRRGGNSREMRNNDGRSYRRGRDSMGRYTSREAGYSYDDDMVSELRELMENAPNDQVKQKIKRLVSEIEMM